MDIQIFSAVFKADVTTRNAGGLEKVQSEKLFQIMTAAPLAGLLSHHAALPGQKACAAW
jgi:hypothetical protein